MSDHDTSPENKATWSVSVCRSVGRSVFVGCGHADQTLPLLGTKCSRSCCHFGNASHGSPRF